MEHPQARKTHCPRNHPYDEQNTRWYTNPNTQKRQRVCRTCAKDRSRKFRVEGLGITVEEWDRLFAEQAGLCAICKAAIATDVDHCHKTGTVGKLLCRTHNLGLGLFDDDPELLEAAAAYLREVR